MEKRTTTTVYLEVPVSERLPDDHIAKFVKTNFTETEVAYYENNRWHGDLRCDERDKEKVTHFLEKKEKMVCISKSQAIKWAGEIWEAGFLNGHSQGADIEKFTNHSDKETFINNLFNQ